MKTLPHAQSVIQKLVALVPEEDGGKTVSELQGQEIATWFETDMGLFMDLDDTPGRFTQYAPSNEWHWKLRQARNRSAYFFDVLRNPELFHPAPKETTDA